MSDTVGAAGAIAVICIAAGVSGATMATTTVHRTTMARASVSPSEADATIITAVTAAATERSDRNGPASAGPFCCQVCNWLSPVVAAFQPAVAVLNLRGASDPQSSARHRSAINGVKAGPTRA